MPKIIHGIIKLYKHVGLITPETMVYYIQIKRKKKYYIIYVTFLSSYWLMDSMVFSRYVSQVTLVKRILRGIVDDDSIFFSSRK